MSIDFNGKLKIPSRELEKRLVVEITDGKYIIVKKEYPGVTLEYDGVEFNINIIPMNLGEFDFIISMDWLSKFEA